MRKVTGSPRSWDDKIFVRFVSRAPVGSTLFRIVAESGIKTLTYFNASSYIMVIIIHLPCFMLKMLVLAISSDDVGIQI